MRPPRNSKRLPSERVLSRTDTRRRLRDLAHTHALTLPPENWNYGKSVSFHRTKRGESSCDRIDRLLKSNLAAERAIAIDMVEGDFRYYMTRMLVRRFERRKGNFIKVYNAALKDVFPSILELVRELGARKGLYYFRLRVAQGKI
jgi:hypothetical protein